VRWTSSSQIRVFLKYRLIDGFLLAQPSGRDQFGAGADINMSKHLFMRAEYRGLVYNSPTFGISRLAGTD
jgi:hypothetical protein